MRPSLRKGVLVLGVLGLLLLWLPLVESARAASPDGIAPQCPAVVRTARSARPVAFAAPQVQHDERTNTTFFFTTENDGAVRVKINAANLLQVEKVVYPDGRVAIVLQAGDDRLSVAVSDAALEVERGQRALRVRLSTPDAADWVRLRTMLVGSRALELFRALAFELDGAMAATPGAAAVALSDAVLGYLDGDVGAIGRLERNFRRTTGARVQVVGMFGAGPNRCWDNYQAMVVAAADDYGGCRRTFRWYDPRQGACALSWTLQAESAWFQFLGCSAVPVPLK